MKNMNENNNTQDQVTNTLQQPLPQPMPNQSSTVTPQPMPSSQSPVTPLPMSNSQTPVMSQSSTTIETKKGKKPSKKLIIIIVTSILALIVLVILGIFTFKALEERKAKTILSETKATEFLEMAFIPGVQEDENLLAKREHLEMSNNPNLVTYKLRNSYDTTGYSLYVKYTDYVAEYKKQYNKDLNLETVDNALAISNLTAKEQDIYEYNVMEMEGCREDNLDTCYVSLKIGGITDKEITYDSYEVKKDYVLAKIHLTYKEGTDSKKLIGNLKVKYTKTNEKYEATEIIIESTEV